ncbi:MAG: class I SAM-dependent methyltransferase [Candidatus Omnitrophica bacterium]|nr:class I SAM-dependent methyltransferase [Candidatus Omnitrophota bacterium]
MIKQIARKILKLVRKIQVPGYLRKNQIKLDISQLKKIEISIRKNYHQGWRSEKKYTSEIYAEDLKNHLIARLENDRVFYIPWFNKIVKLKGANILEIGCGTGSSTVALAEQGAKVTGIDIDEGALKVARNRCKIYNLSATIISKNATEAYNELQNQKFDLVIFYACIEHMVYSERIECLKKYYDLLPKGAYLSIVKTPNRLWYFDGHTSRLPFFHWLPDKVAFDYAKFSKRINFKELYYEYSDEKLLHFLRTGRGFSFHELEIALNIPAKKYKIASYLKQHFIPFSSDRKFYEFLTQIYPNVSKGFFYSTVNIIIKK